MEMLKNLIEVKPKNCIVCQRPSLLRCFGCETAYCSGSCIYKDWDNHHKDRSEVAFISIDENDLKSTGNPRNEDNDQKVATGGACIHKQPKEGTKKSNLKDKSNECFSNADPNSLTFKIMEPKLPDYVKKGLKVSVQERLSKAKEKSVEPTSNLNNSGSSGFESDNSFVKNDDVLHEQSKNASMDTIANNDGSNKAAGEGYFFLSLEDFL